MIWLVLLISKIIYNYYFCLLCGREIKFDEKDHILKENLPWIIDLNNLLSFSTEICHCHVIGKNE